MELGHVMASTAIQRAKQLFIQHKAKLTEQYGLISQLNKIESGKGLSPLPEYLLLGSSNVGKSSLLARLLDPRLKTATKTTNITKAPKYGQPDLPRVSKKAGFTTTLSVYTLPNRLRLIDSPGYGYKSSTQHGDIVQKYLDLQGGVCRQAYVLTHAKRGVSDHDRAVCSLLTQYGIPFSFVITKADLVERLFNKNYADIENSDAFSQIKEDIAKLCTDLDVPQPSQTIVTSTKHSYGVDEMRADMLLLSGLLENNLRI